MTRAFVAIHPDRAALGAVSDFLAEAASREGGAVRWTKPDQVHFTLRFFGDLDDAQLAAAGDGLTRMARTAPPFDLELAGLGVFPDWRRPRVVWLGAGIGGERLSALALALESAFVAAGLGRADKPFRPHLTLGRLREGSRLGAGGEAFLKAARPVIPPFRVEAVRLMGSRLGAGGAVHTELRAVRLEA